MCFPTHLILYLEINIVNKHLINMTSKYIVVSPESIDPERDYHAWVVSSTGEIIDPSFQEEEIIKMINGLSGDKVYEPFDMETQKKVWKMFKSSYEPIKMKWVRGQGGRFRDCPYNAIMNMKKNKGSRIVVGRMGWLREGSHNKVWWEWG